MAKSTESKQLVRVHEELSEDEYASKSTSARGSSADLNNEEAHTYGNGKSTQASSSSETEQSGNESESESSQSEDLQHAAQDFSFGALARAQETLALGKRKRESIKESNYGASISGNDQHRGSKSNIKSLPTNHRSSKHAPMVQSSKRPVSRTLPMSTASSTAQARDPRLDAAVMSNSRVSASHSNKAYSFLADYRASELSALKAQAKKAKDPHALSSLKKQIMSLESKIRAAEAKAQAAEIRRNHRQKEQDLIREGKKQVPYYLKDSEVKKEVRTKQIEGMGAKQRDRREKKKRKKEAGREMKAMPGRRRENVS